MFHCIDFTPTCDYNGPMIKTLRESKATLSALVERASRGEEVVITVRGKPKARLCPIAGGRHDPRAHRTWANELRELREQYSTGKPTSSVNVLDSIREERA